MYAVNEWFPGALTETLVTVEDKGEAFRVAENLANTYGAPVGPNPGVRSVSTIPDTGYAVWDGNVLLAEYTVTEA